MIRAIILATAIAAPAHAQTQCANRADVLAQLADRYGEARTGAGLTDSGALVEVFASAGGSWSITVTTADQRMCLVASGQSYEQHDEPPAPLGVPG